MGLREQILENVDSQRIAVPVPEWGLTLYAVSMNASERGEWEAWCATDVSEGVKERGENILCKSIICATADADGKPVFERADLDLLRGKNGQALVRIFLAVDKLNAISPNARKELEKNFVSDRGGSSLSA